MFRRTVLASIVFASLSFAPTGNHVIAEEQTLYGYSAESSQTERQWEEKLRALPNPENMRAYMKLLSAHPHHVGSPYDKQNAEWILGKFKEFGLDAQIEQFDVLFPTPKERHVELVEGGLKFVAKLQEPAVAVDALCFHNSLGVSPSEPFYDSAQLFARKWSGALPTASISLLR